MGDDVTRIEEARPFAEGQSSDRDPLNVERARSVGHEINNLLVPIITLAALIEDSAPDDQTRVDARTIQESARRIADLLDGLAESVTAPASGPSRKETP